MKLRFSAIEKLSEMVVGDNPLFPYRTSSGITSFFKRCQLDYAHDGSTRRIWARQVLELLNDGECSNADLPSDDLIRIIGELFDADDFYREKKDLNAALLDANSMLARDSLCIYLDEFGGYVKNLGTGNNSNHVRNSTRPLSREELEQRDRIENYLDGATEDEFTEKIIVPLFQRLGFHRVTAVGHKEKIMEYGKDLWMKFQLPTGHWIYFGSQIKKGKIDSSGVGGSSNVANILTQVRMAIDNPIFDQDIGRKVLLDHVFIISSGQITRAARNWLVEKLDADQRRHIIFMDRDEFLNHSARILQDLVLEDDTQSPDIELTSDDIPFDFP